MASLMLPPPMPMPMHPVFTGVKKGAYNLNTQKRVVEYYASAIKTLEVRPPINYKPCTTSSKRVYRLNDCVEPSVAAR